MSASPKEEYEVPKLKKQGSLRKITFSNSGWTCSFSGQGRDDDENECDD